MGYRWRHKKTGCLYEVVTTEAMLQCSMHTEIEVAAKLIGPWVIYRNEHGDYFMRAKREFLDGRFEIVS